MAFLAALLLSACSTTPTAVPASASHAQSRVGDVIRSELITPGFCNAPGAGALSAVVRVATLTGNDGSGVVIASNRVLTAAHVVTDERQALVLIGDEYRDASVIAVDVQSDLAMLDVDTEQLPVLPLARTGLFEHEPVWTVGFPLALDQVAHAGHYQHHVDGAIYTSASTNAGGSGGGLLRCDDGEFELAGMIRGYGAYWRGGELLRIKDLSISVPADTITEFALRSGVPLARNAHF